MTLDNLQREATDAKLPYKLHFNAMAGNNRESSWIFADLIVGHGKRDNWGSQLRRLKRYAKSIGLQVRFVKHGCDRCGVTTHSTSMYLEVVGGPNKLILVFHYETRENTAQCTALVCVDVACQQGHHGRIIVEHVDGTITRSYERPPITAKADTEVKNGDVRGGTVINLTTAKPWALLDSVATKGLRIVDPFEAKGAPLDRNTLVQMPSLAKKFATGRSDDMLSLYGERYVLVSIRDELEVVELPQWRTLCR